MSKFVKRCLYLGLLVNSANVLHEVLLCLLCKKENKEINKNGVCFSYGCVYVHIEQEVKSDHTWSVYQVWTVKQRLNFIKIRINFLLLSWQVCCHQRWAELRAAGVGARRRRQRWVKDETRESPSVLINHLFFFFSSLHQQQTNSSDNSGGFQIFCTKSKVQNQSL